MVKIYKMRDDQVIGFAADELRKYLWTMMPKGGCPTISADTKATDGFRLGLLEDFGLKAEGTDPMWDDEVHIDTTAEGGILAGSNPRSVLFAVYRFLRLNGCRWYYPGPEGEHVPMKDIEPQKYHKLADHRVRGYTIEGNPSMEQVVDWIDYQAKMEMNLFVPSDPYVYMRGYYERRRLTAHQTPETLTHEQAQQWQRTFEGEALRRGLLLKEGGHGTLPSALGLDPADRQAYKEGKKSIPEHVRPYLAMMNGKRDLYKGDIYWTNACLSQPEVRRMLVTYIADRVQEKPFLCMSGVGFADLSRNHCECENCRKLRPADFQIMVANELDEELTRRGDTTTKIALSTYVDLMFPQVQETVKNSERFLIQFTPVSRSYSSSFTEDTELPEPLPYIRNAWNPPRGMDQCAALFLARRKGMEDVPCYAYEYHFWRAQFRDPGLMIISRRIYEDVRSLKLLGVGGYQQDGSNKHFFPHGFHQYIHAETLVNRDCDYEEELKDYFSVLYGEDYQLVLDYLNGVSEAFGEKFMAGEDRAPGARDPLHNPERAVKLEQVYELAARARELAKKNRQTPVRIQALAWRLLERHAEYCDGMANVFIPKCRGFDKLALEKMDEFDYSFGRHGLELERWMDFNLALRQTRNIIVKMPFIEY